MPRAFGCVTLLLGCWLTHPAWADPLPERLVVATWNVEWLFDNYTGDNFNDLARSQAAPSRELWDWKLARVAEVIAAIKPTILALQEIVKGGGGVGQELVDADVAAVDGHRQTRTIIGPQVSKVHVGASKQACRGRRGRTTPWRPPR